MFTYSGNVVQKWTGLHDITRGGRKYGKTNWSHSKIEAWNKILPSQELPKIYENSKIFPELQCKS